MNNKKLLKLSREKFKVNPFAFVCLGVFFCVFAALCFALSLLVPFLGALAIVLLAFPLLFGIIMQTCSIDYFEKVQIRNVLMFSTRYYHPQFAGSFRLLYCFLKSLLVALIGYIVSLIVVGLIAHGMHPAEFEDAFSRLTAYFFASQIDNEIYSSIMNSYNGLLYHTTGIALNISFLIGYFAFLICMFFNAIGVYFRTMLKPEGLMFGRYSINTAIKNNRRKLFKDFIFLNWPLFILGFLGAVCGALLSWSILKDYIYIAEYGLMGCFLFMAIYFPKYLANMNALFDKHKMLIVLGVNDSIRKTIEKIQKSVDLSEEDKQRIEETLKQCDEDVKNMEEENNKKDSTE